jgi:hypothetical protein
MADVQIEGLAALEQEFNRMLRNVGPVSQDALMDVGQDLKSDSQAICPVGDTGDLVGSADVRPQPDGSVEVGYYGIIYAWPQHERLDYQHKPGKSAKFLEGPFEANKGQYIQHIADKSKRIWGG